MRRLTLLAAVAANGEGDTVHYCLPGPIDYALDEVIRVLRRSFDQAPRFYGV